MHAAILVVAFGFWSWVNMRGVTLGVRLNTAITVAKLLPLLLIAVAGVFFVRAENLQVAEWPAAGDFARMSLILVFAFAGIEVALIPSGEVRDPERTVPKAIVLAMVGVTILYIALQVVAQGILGAALSQSAVPLADAAGASLGAWARSLLLAGAAISMFGHLGGMTLSIPRIVYALARDGFLPRALVARAPDLSIAAAGDRHAVDPDARARDHQHLRAARRHRQRLRAGACISAARPPHGSLDNHRLFHSSHAA